MLQRKWSYHVAVCACPPPKNGHHKKRVCLFQDVSCGFIFSVTLPAPWFVLVFPQPRSEVHGSLKVKFGRSNGADGAASAFSLFRGQVYFHFQSPPLFPTHSAFSRARLRKGRSNIGNWKTCSSPDCCLAHLAELRVEGWARPRAHALLNVSVGGSCTFIWGLLSVKAPYLSEECVCVSRLFLLVKAPCSYLWMHILSPLARLFMRVGKIIHGGYFESAVPFILKPLCNKLYLFTRYWFQAEWRHLQKVQKTQKVKIQSK